MSSSSINSAPTADKQPGRFDDGLRPRGRCWLAVTAIFLLASLIRAPIPAVNEPHYLGKAKHWWDPSWCPGDFFLDSSNPHLYFYIAVGWLTKFLSLPETALVLRAVSLGMLASGWVTVSRHLFRSPWSGVLAAAVFTALMAGGNFSGEWLIGGVESKVFSYAFVLWGAASWFAQRAVRASLLLVAAVAFHPVVGLWVLIAGAITAGWRTAAALLQRRSGGTMALDVGTADSHRLLPKPWMPASALLVVGTALAIAPAAPLIFGTDPSLARQADILLLTQRVGHHTDPVLFPTANYLYYGVLLAVWIAAVRLNRGPGPGDQDGCVAGADERSARTLLNQFIAASLVIAAVGLIVGWAPLFSTLDWQHPWRLWLLKFYPFRLADLALPLGVAVELSLYVERFTSPILRGRPQLAIVNTLTAAAATVALMLPAPDANPSGMTLAEYRQWMTVCTWLESHTEPDALIGTAQNDWAIKWFANRPEYVSFKDCPQDAVGILEWWRRRQDLVKWSRQAKADGGISAADLSLLHTQSGMDYLIVTTYGPMETAPEFEYGPFRVFAVK